MTHDALRREARGQLVRLGRSTEPHFGRQHGVAECFWKDTHANSPQVTLVEVSPSAACPTVNTSGHARPAPGRT